MAVDMFLELTDMQGETQDKEMKDKNAIDVLAWSWGMSQSGTTHMGSGGGGGKVNVQDVSVTKYIDKASADLLKFCTKGTHIDKGTLTVRKAGDGQQEYLVLVMEDIIVSSVSSGGSGGEDRLTENITLNFSKFFYTYHPQAEDGSKDKAMEWKYDIAENAEIG